MVDVRKASLCDYFRFLVSFLLLVFSCVVTGYAIVQQQTLFWHVVPGWAALLIFVIVLFLLGIVEGLQIALVELKRQHPDTYRYSHPRAHHLGQLASLGDNVERFLMGRQVFVVLLVYFSAKLTTIHLTDDDDFLFPAPHWFRSIFLETGILACVIVVIIAQLMPQIVAAQFPVHFLEFLIMRPAYYTCVFVEATGLTHICWLLSYLMGIVFGMRADCDDVINVNKDEKKEYSTMYNFCGSSSDGSDIDNMTLPAISSTYLSQEEEEYLSLAKSLECNVSEDTMYVLKQHLDQHPEVFRAYPSVIGGRLYPSPQSLANQIEQQGSQVPLFLSAINHPQHVPPHIAAYHLLHKNQQLRDELAAMKKKQDQ